MTQLVAIKAITGELLIATINARLEGGLEAQKPKFGQIAVFQIGMNEQRQTALTLGPWVYHMPNLELSLEEWQRLRVVEVVVPEPLAKAYRQMFSPIDLSAVKGPL